MSEPKSPFHRTLLPKGDDLYQGFVNLSPDAIVVTDLQTIIIMANMQAAVMHGCESPDELIGRNAFELIAPEDHQRAIENAQKTFEQGSIRDIEYTMLRKDGSRFPAELSASLIADADGAPQAFLGVVRDITERKRWEQAARESEERLRFAIEAAGLGAWDWDVRANRIQWSDTLQDIHGIPRGSFEGTFEAFKRDIHPDDLERVVQNIQSALERCSGYRNDNRIIRPDGEVHWIEARGRVMCDETGQAVSVMGVCMDVTERKQYEEALLRRQQEFRALVENNPDLITRVGRDTRYLHVNPAMERHMGRPGSEFKGKTAEEAGIPPDRAAFWRKHIGPVFETGEEHTIELENRWPRVGQYFTVRLVPERGEDGEVQSVLVIARNITERHRAERRLERIYHLSNAVSRASSVKEICAEALEGMQESLDADRAAVLLFDDDGIMRFTHWSGLSDDYRRATEGHSPWPRDARDPQPVLVPDVEREQTLEALRSVILGEGIRSLAFIPLAYEGQLLGKVMIYYNAPHQFRDDEVQLAQSVASHIALAIERQRAEEVRNRLLEAEGQARTEAQEANRRLTAQYRVGRDLLVSSDVEVGILKALETMGVTLGWDWAAFWQADDSAGEMSCAAYWHSPSIAADLPDTSFTQARVQKGAGLIGKVWATGETIWAEDVHSERAYLRRELIEQVALRSAVFLPVRGERDFLGVIELLSRNLKPLDDNLFRAKEALGRQLGQFIERRKAEEELRRRVEELQTVLDVAPVGIGIATDSESRSIRANRAFAEILRIGPMDNASKSAPPEEMPPYRLLHNGAEMPVDELPIQFAAARGVDVNDVELDVVHEDGTVINLLGSAAPLFDEKGVTRGSVGAFMDITERQRADEEIRAINTTLELRVRERTVELESANEELEAFSYSVSHDLRTPLRAIHGFSRILVEEHAAQLPPEAQRYLRLVQESASDMGKLIDDLLDFARLGRKPLEKQKIDSAALFQKAAGYLLSEEEGREVEITVGDLPPCQADADLLVLVFINLLSNALKFTRCANLRR